MKLKHEMRKLLWKMGYDIIEYTPASNPLARRKQFLKTFKIDVVFDVGANIGQFAQELLKDLDYEGRIISFEPLSSAFKLLKKNSKYHQKWEIYNYALGDVEEIQEINISENSYSSSLLTILPSHTKVDPTSIYTGKELIEVKTMDSIFNSFCSEKDNVYLKIDTQGFESKVLKGAKTSLSMIHTLQLEMSLIPLYDGQLLFNEMCLKMSENGYKLVAVEPGFSDPVSGQLLQVDGIFHRNKTVGIN